MSKFKAKDKSIIPEFVGSLMKAYARRGASKTLKKLKKDPIIRQSLKSIEKLDREIQQNIEKKIKTDPEFAKDYKDVQARTKNLNI
tara:strand:+ start:210 stop:467 length:258 start_codon:yes stop_codon:yes gene_type:complete